MTQTLITSSVLILALILLRAVFSATISRRLQYALWGLVLLRLCLPFGLFSSAFSVMNVFGAAAVRQAAAPAADPDGIKISVGGVMTDAADAAGGSLPEYRPPAAENGGASGAPAALPGITELITPVWLAGGAAFGLWFLASNIRFRLRLRRRRAVFDAPGCGLPVYVTDAVASPCLAGIFRPAVYLTDKAAKSGGVGHILAHETAHYRQGDHIWTALRGVCLVAYWWNPLVWAAAILSRNDGEMACDEAVIRRLGEENRLLYGRTLVDMIAVKNPPAGLLGIASAMTSGSRQLRERLRRIAKNPKAAAPAAAALLLAALVLAGCTFTGPQVSDGGTDDAGAAVTDTGGVTGAAAEVSELARTLYDLKNPYIGDASADGRLLEALGIAGYGGYALELITDSEPYILRLNFSDAITDGAAFDRVMLNNAVVLLALIGNASRIEWNYEFTGGMQIRSGFGEIRSHDAYYTGVLTAEDAAATMNVKDIKAFAQSEAGVQELLDKLPETGAEQAQPADRTDLDACVSEAILTSNGSPSHPAGFACSSHVTLKTVEQNGSVTVYIMALYMEFVYADGRLTEGGGSHMPAAVTFDRNDNGEYTLREYWIPEDGALYMPSIREKFPADITEQDIDTQLYILDQMRACYDQAVRHYTADTGAVIAGLFEAIASSPSVSSNSQDYIDAHPVEYRELLYYGDYTLRYVCSEFQKGGQTGLMGHLMLSAMLDLLGDNAPDYTAASPQDWYDQWQADNGDRLEIILKIQPGD